MSGGRKFLEPEAPAGAVRWRYLLLGSRVPYRYHEWVESDLSSRRSGMRWDLVGMAINGLMVLVVWLVFKELLWSVIALAPITASLCHSKDRARRWQILGWRKEGHDIPLLRKQRVLVSANGRDGMQRYYNR